MKKNRLNSTKYLLILTLPIFLELILQVLVGNVDQLMIASFLDSKKAEIAVAAIGNSNSILNVLVISFSVLSTASIIMITQFKGARQYENEKLIYPLALYFNLAISIIISLILLLLPELFFSWMNVPEEVLADSIIYTKINGGFIFLQALSLTFGAFLRSNALMKEGLIVSIIVNVLNVVGNALLIKEYGVLGVAIASVISRFMGVIVMIFIYYRKVKNSLSLKLLKPFPSKVFKRLMSIGVPSSSESFSYSFSQIVIVSFINIIGQTTTYIITTKFYASLFAMITYIFASAISQAMQVIVGNLLGAKKYEYAKQRVLITTILSVIVSTSIAIILYFNIEFILSFFTSNQQLINLCKQIMFVEIFLELGRAINVPIVRALQTAGDVKFPVALSIIFCWIVAVGGSYLLGIVLELGLVGVWIAMALDELFRAVIFIIRWHNGKWQQIKLVI